MKDNWSVKSSAPELTFGHAAYRGVTLEDWQLNYIGSHIITTGSDP